MNDYNNITRMNIFFFTLQLNNKNRVENDLIYQRINMK